MMEIRYNIAVRKKIQYLRFILISAILFVFSLGFATVGIVNLSTSAKRFHDKKEKLRNIEEKLREKREANKKNKAQIDQIKKKWRKEIKFANDLIKNKTYPFLEKLDKLEELLPAGVYISKIALDSKAGSSLNFNIAAVSSAKLMEAYKTFSPLHFNLAIQKEYNAGGLYKAQLHIKLD
jgi:Tfp pilus assembly protein PilN